MKLRGSAAEERAGTQAFMPTCVGGGKGGGGR